MNFKFMIGVALRRGGRVRRPGDPGPRAWPGAWCIRVSVRGQVLDTHPWRLWHRTGRPDGSAGGGTSSTPRNDSCHRPRSPVQAGFVALFLAMFEAFFQGVYVGWTDINIAYASLTSLR